MKTRLFPASLLALLVLLAIGGLARVWSQSTNPSLQSASMKPTSSAPPVAPIRPVTDDYYGTKITDNYRYMENLKDPEVQAWMKAQDDYTRATLASISGREKLLARVRLFDQTVPATTAARLPGDVYLIRKRLATGNVYKLYVRHGLDGDDRLLVDPETVKLVTAANQGKGTNAILGSTPSSDARYVAVAIAPGGSENDTEIHVFETASGRETGDVVLRAEGGATGWLRSDHAFLYMRLQTLPPGAPVTEIEQKVRTYLHVLGTDATKDPAVFGYGVVPTISVDPAYFAAAETSPNSDYALGMINSGVSPNSAFYIESVSDIGKTNTAWRKIADFSDDVADVEMHGDDLYILSYKNALRYKVMRTSARHPDLATAETVIPESQAVVTSISTAQDALYVQLLDGGIGRVLRVPYGPKPQVQEVALPFRGSVDGLQTDPRLPGGLLYMESWTRAYQIYAYDPQSNAVTNTKIQPTGPYDHPGNIESVEVKARSYDGAMVPLSIIYPKSAKLDGSNPTWLDGYGSYGITSNAYFDPKLLAWYEQGGIYAECHVRGGGEYGEGWHLAGKGATKPNTWRDFIACAQYLIDHKYTSPARLAGSGTSAGGILIGRAITSRPDLFAAAIDWVGASDMLRIETTANGVPNIPEFGSVRTKAGFDALYAMSAYAHIKDHTPYPAVLFMTGANDPRIDPWQMDKMAARMQAATSSGRPVLLRVNYAGGHQIIGGTEEETQRVYADQMSFLLWQFAAPGFQQQKP